MTIEEMLKFLGVRTQSNASIDLCYKMDMEAFNMMKDNSNSFIKDKYVYTCVYNVLLDELNYKKLDKEEKEEALKIINKIDLNEEDKEYKDMYFTGLERVLLRYNRHDLINIESNNELSKLAYLAELNGEYGKALELYNKLGFGDRVELIKLKISKKR